MSFSISVKNDFDRMAATLNDLARRQFPFATARTLNEAAACATTINADIAAGQIFGKATPFTRNAVVAPKSLGARKDRLMALVTVRPIQAQYLLHEEIGGTRTPAENTRKPDAKALVLPAPALPLNSYRNIPAGKLAKLKAAAADTQKHGKGLVFLAANAPGNKAGIGGYFKRDGTALHRLTGFRPSTSYHPKFGFGPRVVRTARETFAARINQHLTDAMATANRVAHPARRPDRAGPSCRPRLPRAFRAAVGRGFADKRNQIYVVFAVALDTVKFGSAL